MPCNSKVQANGVGVWLANEGHCSLSDMHDDGAAGVVDESATVAVLGACDNMFHVMANRK